MAEVKKVLPVPVTGAELGFNQGAAEETFINKEIVDGGQIFSGATDPATGQTFESFVPGVVGVDDNVNKVTEGSDGLRDNATVANNNLKTLDNTETNAQNEADDAIDFDAEFEDLRQMSADIGRFTSQDNDAIADAEAAERARFAPLIEDAKERGRQGLAESTVAAGRRGGFQRARIAGQAALGPTQGDVGYRGAGGKLELVESAFQRNVDDLKAQQQRAISLAKSATRAAIRSQKTEDFNRATKIFEAARQLEDDKNKVKAARVKAVADLRAEEREKIKLGLSVGSASRDEVKFASEQSQKTSEIAALNLIDVDEVGNIIEPSEAEIIAIAKAQGISPISLVAELNKRIDEVEKIQAGKRKDTLAELKTVADTERTQFLTEKGKTLLPFSIREKQLSIDSKLLSIAKSQKALTDKDTDPESLGITQVEVLGDLQATVNGLNTGGLTLDQVAPELQPFVSLGTNELGENQFRLNEPTEAQFKIMVKRRAETLQSHIQLEDSVASDLQNDPSKENQEELKGLLTLQGFNNSEADGLIKQIARQNNIDLGETGRLPGQDVAIVNKQGGPKEKDAKPFGLNEEGRLIKRKNRALINP